MVVRIHPDPLMDDSARTFDQTEMEAVAKELRQLTDSNQLLLAELGRIAGALGVGCSMREVLGVIELLKSWAFIGANVSSTEALIAQGRP